MVYMTCMLVTHSSLGSNILALWHKLYFIVHVLYKGKQTIFRNVYKLSITRQLKMDINHKLNSSDHTIIPTNPQSATTLPLDFGLSETGLERAEGGAHSQPPH